MRPDPRGAAAALLLAMIPAAAWPLESDSEQPIRIEADSVQIDDLNGVSVYQGNVVYSQGTIRLEADIVEVYHDEHRNVSRIEARGEPARFRQRLDGEDEDMRANARRMEYHADPRRLVLEHDAWIWRQDVEFTGDYISYDPGQDVVSARRSESEEGRVHIVIQPQQGGASIISTGEDAAPSPPERDAD